MSEHVYRMIEIVGTSEAGLADAITNGISRAAQTVEQLAWFEVEQIRGHISNQQVAHYQVAMKVGFTLQD